MPTPPSERVRPLKRETAATGGDAADTRPWPATANPKEDALDVRGVFFQQSDSDDVQVAAWRENGQLHFRDTTVGAGLSFTLSQLADKSLSTDGQHGNRGGGSLHALATQSAHGFMSGTDKSRIDSLWSVHGNKSYLPLSGGTLTGRLDAFSGVYGLVPSTASTMVGNEYNVLLYAEKRGITVTQTGVALIDLASLTDGRLAPTYSSDGIPPDTPTVITFEGLPNIHTQTGGVVGWTSRYWYPQKFKVEAWDSNDSTWHILRDQSSVAAPTKDLLIPLNQVRSGFYTKLRFTIYEAYAGGVGANGYSRFGISEIFFIHPEAAKVNQYLDYLYAPIDNPVFTGIAKVGTNTIWHAGNDGTGSGLDADLLDGQHGSYYLDPANLSAAVPLSKGGTGATSKTAAFNALSPTTTGGDFIYRSGSNDVRLPGNTTATKKFLSMTSAVPSWVTLGADDVDETSTRKWVSPDEKAIWDAKFHKDDDATFSGKIIHANRWAEDRGTNFRRIHNICEAEYNDAAGVTSVFFINTKIPCYNTAGFKKLFVKMTVEWFSHSLSDSNGIIRQEIAFLVNDSTTYFVDRGLTQIYGTSVGAVYVRRNPQGMVAVQLGSTSSPPTLQSPKIWISDLVLIALDGSVVDAAVADDWTITRTNTTTGYGTAYQINAAPTFAGTASSASSSTYWARSESTTNQAPNYSGYSSRAMFQSKTPNIVDLPTEFGEDTTQVSPALTFATTGYTSYTGANNHLHQLFFGGTGNLYIRKSTNATTWGDWKQVWSGYNFDPDGKADKAAFDDHVGSRDGHPTATTSDHGFMSATDKTRTDSLWSAHGNKSYLLSTGKAADSDKLDGQHGSYYLDSANLTGTVPAARLPVATSSTIGAVKIGSNISVDANGVISTHAPYSLPTGLADIVSLGAGTTGVGQFLKKNAADDWVLSAAPVTSVNSKTGAVTLGANDIAESTTRKWLSASEKTLATALAGITTDGMLRKTGSTWDVVKHTIELQAGTYPGSAADVAAGYTVGSRFINSTDGKEYVCTKDTPQGAVWKLTTYEHPTSHPISMISGLRDELDALAAATGGTIGNLYAGVGGARGIQIYNTAGTGGLTSPQAFSTSFALGLDDDTLEHLDAGADGTRHHPALKADLSWQNTNGTKHGATAKWTPTQYTGLNTPFVLFETGYGATYNGADGPSKDANIPYSLLTLALSDVDGAPVDQLAFEAGDLYLRHGTKGSAWGTWDAVATRPWVANSFQIKNPTLTDIIDEGFHATSTGYLKKTAKDTWALDTTVLTTASNLAWGKLTSIPATISNLITVATTAAEGNGFLKKTGSGTWDIDTATYAASNHGHNELTSTVANGTSAVGFTLSTPTYTTAGTKLLSLKNGTAEKFSVDKDGWVVSAVGFKVGTTPVSVSGHGHAANAIISGVIDIARIPTGTTSTTVALGNHTHTIADLPVAADGEVSATKLVRADDSRLSGGGSGGGSDPLAMKANTLATLTPPYDPNNGDTLFFMHARPKTPTEFPYDVPGQYRFLAHLDTTTAPDETVWVRFSTHLFDGLDNGTLLRLQFSDDYGMAWYDGPILEMWPGSAHDMNGTQYMVSNWEPIVGFPSDLLFRIVGWSEKDDYTIVCGTVTVEAAFAP